MSRDISYCSYCGCENGEREFIGILAQNVPEDLCTYPEYKGKPYYSIHYKENGEEFVGFGTYNLEVLSGYLKEYFMKGDKEKKKRRCGMSYQERALAIIDRLTDSKAINIRERGTLRRAILLPERPQGKWIIVSRNCWKCPYCQELTNEGKNFCSNCGAKMKGGAE